MYTTHIVQAARRNNILIVAALLLAAFVTRFSTLAQVTAFTYQGRLSEDAKAVNGNYDLTFGLYDTSSAGSQQGNLLTNSATAVSNGLFTVTLDFGSQFSGAARWLEIGVRTNGAASFSTLSPRQALTPAPYAITAGNVVSGGLSAGAYASAVSFSNPANNFAGSFAGNGTNLTNVNAASLNGMDATAFWQLGGNNVAPGQFLGSLNNQALEFRAGNQRALRLEFGASYSPNVIGGSSLNSVSNGVGGATIAGGGRSYTIFSSTFYESNLVTGWLGTIGGGSQNTIGTNSAATISGGYNNAALALKSTIGGGAANRIESGASFATIGGGDANTNLGFYATIPGGDQNVAASYSLAAGHRAKATHSGVFLWADSSEADFASTAHNQFLVRAAGNVGINTNNPLATLDVNGSFRAGSGTTIFRNLQGGTAQMASGSATVKTNFSFTFPKAFTAVPNVILSARSGNVVPVDDTFVVSVRDVTTTTCTVNIVRVDNPSGWSQQVKVNWLAWE